MEDKLVQGSMLRSDIRQGFGISFLFAVAGIVISLCFDSLGTLKATINNPLIYGEYAGICVLYFYFNAISFGGVFSHYMFAILAALPFAASYSIEQQNGAVVYRILRSSKRNYCSTKILVSAISGGLTACIGCLLFILALSTYLPLITTRQVLELSTFPYGCTLSIGGGVPYFVISLYLAFLRGALYSSVGMCVSAFLPNPYIAVCSPMIFEFFLVECGRLLRLPAALRLDLVLLARGTLYSDSATLLIVTVVVSSIIILCFKLFSARCERRLTYGA